MDCARQCWVPSVADLFDLTDEDREVLATAPVGRAALQRIEDLEKALELELWRVRFMRETIDLLEEKFAQAFGATAVQSGHEARSAGGSGPVGVSGEPRDGGPGDGRVG